MLDTRQEIKNLTNQVNDLKSAFGVKNNEIEALTSALSDSVSLIKTKSEALTEVESEISEVGIDRLLEQSTTKLLLKPFELGLSRRLDIEPGEVLPLIEAIPDKVFPLKNVSARKKVATFGLVFKIDSGSAAKLAEFIRDPKVISKVLTEMLPGKELVDLLDEFIKATQAPVLAVAAKKLAELNGKAQEVRGSVNDEILKQQSIEVLAQDLIRDREHLRDEISAIDAEISKYESELHGHLLTRLRKATGVEIDFSDFTKIIKRSELFNSMNLFIDLLFSSEVEFDSDVKVLMDEFRIPQEVMGCAECKEKTGAPERLDLLKHTIQEHHGLTWIEFCDLMDRNWKSIWPVFWYNETQKWEYLEYPEFHRDVSHVVWHLRIVRLMKEPIANFEPSLTMSFASTRDLDTLLRAYNLDTDKLFDFMEKFPEILKNDSRRRVTFKHWLATKEHQVALLAVASGSL